MFLRNLSVLAAVLLAACATPASAPTNPADRLVATRLERFSSEAAFRAYLRQLRDAAHARGAYWAERRKAEPPMVPPPNLFAPPSPMPPPPPPAPPPPPSVAAPSPQAAIGTGAPAQAPLAGAATANDVAVFPDANLAEATAAADASITNVQTHGVDEGDIVKRIGHFMIVLQDGRLFTVDMRPNGRAGLAFVDRVDVYRNQRTASWYDEMLVHGNRVLVTGYSYQVGASEISVFVLGQDGKLTRESVFYMTSNDYYDIENYATRLVGDALVVYTPLDLTRIDPEQALDFPVIRRWVRGEGERAVYSKPERLFQPSDIHRPLQSTLQPTVHAISVCPLGSLASGDELACTATAFIGPSGHEFYISPQAAYLWVNDDENRVSANTCDAARGAAFDNGPRATLFRAPFSGEAGAMFVRGQPRDQMGFASTAEEFRALLVWDSGHCASTDTAYVALKYFHAPLSAFSATPPAIDAQRYTAVPTLNNAMFEQRFTDDYVIYGARETWYSYPPAGTNVRAQVVAVPTANPANATVLEAPHNVLRVERVANNAVITGYGGNEGLSVSLLDLSATPRIAATTFLAGRYETEGRSHAFNSRPEPDGGALMGIPTARAVRESGRWWFRSRTSDLSFIALDEGALRGLGELTQNPRGPHRSYRCEVSCVDWYGNSRPIFTDGRIFALMGTEMVEGVIENGRVRSLQRADLSAPPPRANARRTGR